MKIAILGCGPSGLAAAHAALNTVNCSLDIFSKKVKSPMWGAQYLHGPVPGIPSAEPTLIRYIMRGAPEDYLRKVYADKWDGTINDEMRTQAHLAWDIRTTTPSRTPSSRATRAG